MIQLETQILIQAPVDQVWKVLTDLEAYQEWNPFIIKIEGKAQKDTYLKNTLQFTPQKQQVFSPIVLDAIPNQLFRWRGKLFIKGLFDGEHYFQLVPIDATQTKLIHGEKFTGLLVKPLMRSIREQTLHNFEAMNEALKARVESLYVTNE
ncbi:MAG: SRPBCC family protein [Thermonemataceae bacterium]